jgi:predicted RNase H-like nuclease (RuvC/YqgF family)
MTNSNIPYQYNSGPMPVDSTSPINGATDSSGDKLNLKATIQRQDSQLEILSRELKRTQSRVRELESQLQSVISTLRRER